MTVTSLDDSGPGSLRQAILDANASGGGDITFSNVTGTITLLSALPSLTNITITGPGRDLLKVSGGAIITNVMYPVGGDLWLRRRTIGTNQFPVFIMNSGTTNALSGLTIADGSLSNYTRYPDPEVSLCGAGISNAGTLKLLDCAITGCSFEGNGCFAAIYNAGDLLMQRCEVADCAQINIGAAFGGSNGGGIANDGDLRMEDCAVSGCIAQNSGGGIANGGNLFLTNCIISSCLAWFESNGGGIYNPGSLTMHSCVVSNCRGDWCGGIYSSGNCAITNSTIINNYDVDFCGGGLLLFGGTNVMVGCTVRGNHANWLGGGALNRGVLSLFNCTFSENFTDTDHGGAIVNAPLYGATNPTVYAKYCTIVESSGVLNAGIFRAQDCLFAGEGTNSVFSGVLTSEGYNLLQDTNGCTIEGDETGNIYNQDPTLGPLDDYGGPTPTIPLLAGSPAIDAGGTGYGLPTDQRGRARPYGAACDIGAFESSPPYVIRGKLLGSTLDEPLTLLASPGDQVTVSYRAYGFDGLSPDTYTITPSNANFHIIPSNRVVTVGPDEVRADFKGFRWNALSMEGLTNGFLHLIYAGTNGESVRTLASSDLVDWTTIFTNTVPPTNLFDIFDPTTQPWRFYQTLRP